MCVSLVVYEALSPEQEKIDAEKIHAHFDDVSAVRLFPGIWIVMSSPSPGTVQHIFLQILGYSPRCLVSSMSESAILHLKGEDRELGERLRAILPPGVQIW